MNYETRILINTLAHRLGIAKNALKKIANVKQQEHDEDDRFIQALMLAEGAINDIENVPSSKKKMKRKARELKNQKEVNNV